MIRLTANKPVLDPQRIESFLTRGVEKVFPSTENVRDRMLKGERLTMYLGIDPTGPTLHLGHSITLKKLKEFQELGHQVILLIGDFTGMIGDPTDKTAARKKLTRAEVLKNAKLYKKQASAFLKFSGSNKAILKYNSAWLSKMKFNEVLELASLMTVDQMLKRDMFDKRVQEGKPIYIHEFMYPLMQGYDSVAMDVDGEIGGNDQTFNMLAGRHLMRVVKDKEKFVIASKLLVDPSGKKMGKTEGNMVSLDQSAGEMFGKIMSWTDDLIIPAFELCTFVSDSEIADMKKSMEAGANPRDLKVKLAKAIIAIYHGEPAALKAEEVFVRTFVEKTFSDEAVEITTTSGTKLGDIVTEAKIVESKSEYQRLVKQGAVSDSNGNKISDIHFAVTSPIDIKIGKRKFVKIKL